MKFLQSTTAILLMGVLLAVAQAGPQFIPNGGQYYGNVPKPVKGNRFSLYGFISGFLKIRSSSDVPKPTPGNFTVNFYDGSQYPPKYSKDNSRDYSYNDNSDSQYGEERKWPKRHRRGVAQILYDGQKHICNGVQLRPWLLLTAAKCVYGIDLKRLKARINIKWRGAHTTAVVDAVDMAIHPKYNPKRLEYNFAMLIVDSKMEWEIYPFIPEKQGYTTDSILKKGHQTLVDQMHHYDHPSEYIVIKEIESKLTRDFEVCNEIGEATNWYCAEKGSGRAKYTKADIGTPLYFYNKNSDKMLLGIYTGRRYNEEVNGHVFESIYPVLDFINRFYATRQRPPYIWDSRTTQ